MRDFDRALTEFNQAIRLDAKESSAYYSVSLVYQQKGSDQLAAAKLRQSNTTTKETHRELRLAYDQLRSTSA